MMKSLRAKAGPPASMALPAARLTALSALSAALSIMFLAALLAAVSATAPAAAATPAAESIRAFEPDSLERIVAARKGRPFVVMVWSLDCDYCHESFEALAKAMRGAGGFDVVTIAADRADDPQAAALIRRTLAAAGLNRDMWAFGAAPPERLRHAIDPKWRGEMPRSYWFDARGNVRPHSGLITPEVAARLSARAGS